MTDIETQLIKLSPAARRWYEDALAIITPELEQLRSTSGGAYEQPADPVDLADPRP